MATMNFSVPDQVKTAFDRAFAGRNKSAILTDLMREAVDRQAQQRQRAKAVRRLLALRRRLPPVSDRAIRAARTAGRP